VLFCLKIISNFVDENTSEVKGIEMVKNGRTYFIKSRKEVISAAGAINSPQLLMLSGVGPKKHLQQLGTDRNFT